MNLKFLITRLKQIKLNVIWKEKQLKFGEVFNKGLEEDDKNKRIFEKIKKC